MKLEIHIEKVLVEGTAISSNALSELQAATRAGIEGLLAGQSFEPGMYCNRKIHRVERHTPSPADINGPKSLGRQLAAAIMGGIAK